MSTEHHHEDSTHVLKTHGRFEKINYQSDDRGLSANVYFVGESPDEPQPGLLMLHGGGTTGKSTFRKLQRILRKRGIASLAYDAPGVGESVDDGSRRGGETLNTRLVDAQNSLDVFKQRVNISKLGVIGMSMGGDVAVNMTELEEVDALALLSPAAYPDSLRNQPLYLGFTRQTREKTYNWAEQQTFARLRGFANPTMVMYGQQDRIIPSDVREQYQSILQDGHPENEVICLLNASHNFLRPHTLAEAEVRTEAIAHISRFTIAQLDDTG